MTKGSFVALHVKRFLKSYLAKSRALYFSRVNKSIIPRMPHDITSPAVTVRKENHSGRIP